MIRALHEEAVSSAVEMGIFEGKTRTIYKFLFLGLCLLLILGAVAFANSDTENLEMGTTISVPVDAKLHSAQANQPPMRECFLEGPVFLRYSGDEYSGWIWGRVGQESIQLNVFYGRATGWIRDTPVWLDLNQNFGSSMVLSGWIRRAYVFWRGSFSGGFGYFSDYQPCIPMD